MRRFGSDKPDLRFGMEIQDATEITRGSEFGVFENAPCVRYIVVPQTFSRAEHETLEDFAKEWGAKGLAYLVNDARMLSPISKFLSEAELARSASRAGATALFVARRAATVAQVLGLLRLHLARELDLIDPASDALPLGRRLPALQARRGDRALDVHAPPVHGADARARGAVRVEPGGVRGQHYDLVWNGWELGSGSIRIHDVEMQQARLPRRWASARRSSATKFGFLLDALAMGAPPHGGFAMGIDRFFARLAGRAGHPPDDRVPEGLERLRPAHRRADPDAGQGAGRARDPLDRRGGRESGQAQAPDRR